MKVQMKVSISGTRDGQDWPAIGEIVDLPNDEAVSMLNAGLVSAVESSKPETRPSSEPTKRAATKRAPKAKA